MYQYGYIPVLMTVQAMQAGQRHHRHESRGKPQMQSDLKKKLRVAIVGASGYTGVELLRIMKLHPAVEVTVVTSRQNQGTPVEELFPSLHGYADLKFTAPDVGEICQSAEIVFTAVPHQTAMAVVPGFLEAGLKVIDLSADFRIREQAVYEKWYQEHSAPELLNEAVYGLPELYREKIADTRLAANPGCYPTSTILPLAPLLNKGMVLPENIIVDSKSGTSGAGRGAAVATLFCEVNEGFKAYKVGNHRHTPEIEQELSAAAGRGIRINFTPHLVPMNRGILSTIYCRLSDPVTTTETVQRALEEFYENAPFVRILPSGQFPNVSSVRGSNYCDIGVSADSRTGTLILVSVIDNLVKGASGQAVQNMNIMCGLPQTTALETGALFP